MKSDLSKVKVGDKIWTIQNSFTEVLTVNLDRDYSIVTEECSYTIDGKLHISDKHPSAFLEYPFKELSIEKDTLVWFRDSENEAWKFGYYSHFKNGQHFCFLESKKSTETGRFTSYKIVTTENPLI